MDHGRYISLALAACMSFTASLKRPPVSTMKKGYVISVFSEENRALFSEATDTYCRWPLQCTLLRLGRSDCLSKGAPCLGRGGDIKVPLVPSQRREARKLGDSFTASRTRSDVLTSEDGEHFRVGDLGQFWQGQEIDVVRAVDSCRDSKNLVCNYIWGGTR